MNTQQEHITFLKKLYAKNETEAATFRQFVEEWVETHLGLHSFQDQIAHLENWLKQN